MAKGGKGALALILGGGKPPAGEDDVPDATGSEQATMDAQAVIDAIQSGDAEGLVSAFAALKESCEAYESETEPDDDMMDA